MEDEYKKYEENVDAYLKGLEEKIDDLEKTCEDFADNELKKHAIEIRDKTVAAFNGAMEAVEKKAKEVGESEEFKKAVELIETKTKELYDTTVAKINELKNTEKLDKSLDEFDQKVSEKAEKISEDIEAGVEYLTDKETIKGTVDVLKDVAIGITEKAAEALKKWIDSENSEDNKNSEEKS